jgi:hypothetical protein
MATETPYREGNDDSEPVGASPEAAPPVSQELPVKAPEESGTSRKTITAVLLVQFDDGKIDAITDLPSVEKNHAASLREVRNMCSSMLEDVSCMIQAKMTISELKMDMARTQAQSQVNDQISKIKNVIQMPGAKK